jgi:hypothetical protein
MLYEMKVLSSDGVGVYPIVLDNIDETSLREAMDEILADIPLDSIEEVTLVEVG